jgi:hypothetical protein
MKFSEHRYTWMTGALDNIEIRMLTPAETVGSRTFVHQLEPLRLVIERSQIREFVLAEKFNRGMSRAPRFPILSKEGRI